MGAPDPEARHPAFAEQHFDTRVARLAELQDLVFAKRQLNQLGASDGVVYRRVRTGRWHRVHRGVYSLVAPSRLSANGRYRAAVLACEPRGAQLAAGPVVPAGPAVSHRSAADLHGLRVCHRRSVEVIVAGDAVHRHDGIDVHRSATLTTADLTVVDGIPVTAVARTLLDIAAVVVTRELERACDQAEVLGVFDLRALQDQLARHPRAPGAGALRAVLDGHLAGSTVTDSELDEVMLALCRRYDLPDPQFQRAVDPGDGRPLLRPDCCWPAATLAVELDGRRFHATRRAFEEDRTRDQRLQAAGWRVIRVTWRQLEREPERIAELLRRLLGAAPPTTG